MNIPHAQSGSGLHTIIGIAESDSESTRERIEASAVFMEQHMHENVTRGALSKIAGMNPEYYSRMFTKYRGLSPIEYLTKLRMDMAKQLLQNTDVPIKQIAKLVGFEDPYYFSRRFKQEVGLAPSLYMKQSEQRIVALSYYGHLRTLGFQPVGAAIDGGAGYYSDWADYAQEVSCLQSPYYDYGRIEQLHPQIIFTDRKEKEKDKPLSELAEVYVVDLEQDPIYEQLTSIASHMNKEHEALEWVNAYELRASELRKRLKGTLGEERVAILRIRANLLQVYGNMIMGYPLYRSLELNPPMRMTTQFAINRHFHSNVISIDELSYYAAEHIFVVIQPGSEHEQVWESIQALTAWKEYPAVLKGNVYPVEMQRWLAYDPQSIMMQMEEAAEHLLTRSTN
ncbi:MAG: hypothetical protein K0R67_951 [Paenibacillus sp.]|nr:hypothetical protein [Paenibacillus sp.]